MEELDYYSVGTVEHPVYSNSGGSKLNPEEGGSPKKFFTFLGDNEEKKEKLSLSRGKLVHTYIESPDDFIVADVDAPSEMMMSLVEAGFRGESEGYDFYESALLPWEAGEAYKAMKHDTVINKIKTEAGAYIEFIRKSEGKHVLPKKEKEIIENIETSIHDNELLSCLLDMNMNRKDYDGVCFEEDKVYKELPIYWQDKVDVLGFDRGTDKASLKINCKAKLDVLRVNMDKKIITYVDAKTTGKSIYLYPESFVKYKTHRQLSTYKRAISRWFKSTFPDEDITLYSSRFFIGALETFGHFQSGVYEVENHHLYEGLKEFKSLTSRLAFHIYTKEREKSYEEIKGKGILKLGKLFNV